MSWIGWFTVFLIIQLVHFAGTWKLYQIAGRKSWEAAVPVYNAIVLMKIINRPWWWTILLFVPIVNLIMFPVIWVETLRSFGRNSTADTVLVLLTFGLYIYYVNYTQNVSLIENRSLKPRTSAGEWVSSILFAVVAATIVHTYVMQPFTIPTSSLEKTLLVGDFLFVSKFHYGARTPMTAVSFPMVHDTIPVIRKKSYLPKPQIPYFRLPGFQEIKRNDIVVFNWPVDTVNAFQQYGDGKYYYKPIDKKSNYVKRAVGMPGDSLEVREGYVFINGKQNELPDRARLQFRYALKTTGQINPQLLVNRYDITDGYEYDQENSIYYFRAISDESLDKIRNNPSVLEVIPLKSRKGQWDRGIFPNHGAYPWNNDFFGPLYIPKEGATVAITPETLPLYKRIIEVYEGSEIGLNNKVTQSAGEILLNGKPITEYTFKMDYYWMMGDNRNNSEDARTWGFVPFNHVVGKPVFVWMSWDGINKKVRWDRVFTTVGGSGKPVSYFIYFVGLVIAWFAFDFFRKRKKAAGK
ncbi:signal peptidase I [Aequorivita viscosa]|uniref:Signal peptidase I n=1 Tax=Aequorivita viscosa TaxID=797419 RepID=A0A1M6LGF6_9FLAO|nr:signal peptidase I [Aequorivita viscosa]SDV99790.1 signal peptidase I [Aequorivita viscosa]SHJ70249.1 signal peptidase I [Aequorivita viscosa]